MIAPHDRKQATGIWESPLFYVLDPRAVHSDRYLMFCLARHGAGVAADALSVVDYEAKIH
jgi:hypothetical protein